MKSKVENLQADGTLPCESYTLEYWEQQFSHILKITFKNKIYFLKQIKPRIDHHNDELLNKLIVEYEALTKYEPYFRNNDNCNIPKVIYFSHEELLLVTEKLDGISLGGVFRQYVGRLTKGASETETVFRRVGAFYSAFHSFEIQLYQLGHLEALIAYIEERLICTVFTDEEQSQISFYLESVFKILKSDLSNYTFVPVHHDPNFSNILYDDSSINVLDFGDFAFDSPYQDIACFKLMIDGQFVSSIKYSHGSKKKLLNAFCEGYNIDLKSLVNDPLYQLYLLKNLSIFLKTFVQRSKVVYDKSRDSSKTYYFDKLMNSCDLNQTKKRIQKIVSSTIF